MSWEVRPQEEWSIDRPEGPPGYLLDAMNSGDAALQEHIWTQFGERIRAEARKPIAEGGSWNFKPVNLTAWYCTRDEAEARGLFERYVRRQLNRDANGNHRGLWGQEWCSRIYTWPVACLDYAHQVAEERNDTDLSTLLADACWAHACVLALQAVPFAHPESSVSDVFFAGAGQRSSPRSVPGDQINDITRILAGHRGPSVPTPDNKSGWARRLSWTAERRWLDAPRQERLWSHIQTGGDADFLIAELKRLGVTARVPVFFWRYRDGCAGLTTRIAHGSTAPTLALSFVKERWEALDLWRDGPSRGGLGAQGMHKTSFGAAECRREEDWIFAEARDVRTDPAPGSEPKEESLKVYRSTIVAPNAASELVYGVRFDANGVSRITTHST